MKDSIRRVGSSQVKSRFEIFEDLRQVERDQWAEDRQVVDGGIRTVNRRSRDGASV